MPKNLTQAPAKSTHADSGLNEREPEDREDDDLEDEDEEDAQEEHDGAAEGEGGGEGEADTGGSKGGDAEDPDSEGDDDRLKDEAGDGEGEDHQEGDDKEKDRRRVSKKERRARQKAARDADKRLIQSLTEQLNQVNRKVEQLDTRGNQHDLARLDEAIQSQRLAYQRAEHAMQKAMGDKDAKAFTAALTARDEARDRFNTLTYTKSQAQQNATRRKEPSFDPVIVNHAKKFAADHPWYDIQGKDQDSKIVMSLDQQLIDEGFVPRTPQYWAELRSRARRFLPHRFEAPDKQNGKSRDEEGQRKRFKGKPKMGGGGFSGGGVQRGSGPVLSKARREALLAMGLEPNSPEWNSHVKNYQAYDKQNPPKR